VVFAAVKAVTDTNAKRLSTDSKPYSSAEAATFRSTHELILVAVVALCGLTFELRGRKRHGAWPARRMMT
jgi:hypothetical protein